MKPFDPDNEPAVGYVARLEAENARLVAEVEELREELTSAKAQVTIANNSNGFLLLADERNAKLVAALEAVQHFLCDADPDPDLYDAIQKQVSESLQQSTEKP